MSENDKEKTDAELLAMGADLMNRYKWTALKIKAFLIERISVTIG